MNPQRPRSLNPNYRNTPKINQIWSDAIRFPSHSNTPLETHTYVPETQYVRQNPPSPLIVETKFTAPNNYDYGTLPSNPRYKLIESQPGNNAWNDDFFVPSAEHGFIYEHKSDQLVSANRTSELNSYDFESPR